MAVMVQTSLFLSHNPRSNPSQPLQPSHRGHWIPWRVRVILRVNLDRVFKIKPISVIGYGSVSFRGKKIIWGEISAIRLT